LTCKRKKIKTKGSQEKSDIRRCETHNSKKRKLTTMTFKIKIKVPDFVQTSSFLHKKKKKKKQIIFSLKNIMHRD
jgi:hypothetical protein